MLNIDIRVEGRHAVVIAIIVSLAAMFTLISIFGGR